MKVLPPEAPLNIIGMITLTAHGMVDPLIDGNISDLYNDIL
jgi:hypothetical protein